MQAFMANIIMPLQTLEEAEKLQRRLLEEYNIYTVYGSVPAAQDNNKLIVFVRISAQVYLDMSDFVLLAKAVKECLVL
jgi:selenocysteine lyase/cysteine desulfurase